MKKTEDPHIQIARLQREISQKLELPLDNLIFSFSQSEKSDKKIHLDLITLNPRHDESFLYHSVEAREKAKALEKMLDYVVKNFRKIQSYTVQWAQKGKGELHTSYFRAADMYEVLEKFYHGREKDTYTIFSITLNPIA